jgi:hypothetical protein
MKNLTTLAMTLLTMTLLSSGAVFAATEGETAKEAVVAAAAPQTPEQATETTTAPATATTTAPEQKNRHSLASRNAAAMKLKAELDKHNAAPGSQPK